MTEELQKTKRLSLAQSLALKAAIVKLGDQSSASAVDERSERHGTRRLEYAAAGLPLKMEALALDEEGTVTANNFKTLAITLNEKSSSFLQQCNSLL